MKRLQLGSSLGSSMDTPLHRTENQAPMPVKSQSIDVSSINHKDCKLTCDWYFLSYNNFNNDHDVLICSSRERCYFGVDASHRVSNTGTTEKRCTRPSTVTTIITGSKWNHFPREPLEGSCTFTIPGLFSPPSCTLFNPCRARHQSVAHSSAWR